MDFSALIATFTHNPWPTVVSLMVLGIIALSSAYFGTVRWVLSNMVLKSVNDINQQTICGRLDEIKDDTTVTRALVEKGQ